ncbi:uncharacterized protein Z520_11742 [Fonsecaea multimorphosa CBS 102226]|uniref:Uncharacterized protein n=1 Tax=Fonsecaea multimorphosa CBS 102226 TaxID=1442371 RepID=A0A0D2I5L9_9EURO|nr:uncharacterized protein Z520_11742 [Fonsecaea multimorphosa CBS 102226]KIX92566.1 hypothetical protein Z520_11742 [Fonsecaea multimorphosa CBS 102226]OAL17831.1 hypothetical protein AYO22_11258 [Fonsecaea multimorphosa]
MNAPQSRVDAPSHNDLKEALWMLEIRMLRRILELKRSIYWFLDEENSYALREIDEEIEELNDPRAYWPWRLDNELNAHQPDVQTGGGNISDNHLNGSQANGNDPHDNHTAVSEPTFSGTLVPAAIHGGPTNRIARLTEDQVNAILEVLELPTAGTPADKKETLRVALGAPFVSPDGN